MAEISVRFKGQKLAEEADQEVTRLQGELEGKTAIRKALDNARGLVQLDVGAEHEANKEFLEALRVYREVVEKFKETEAAKTATAAIDRITTDSTIQATMRALRADEEAERWLDLGDRYAKLGMHDQAREYYNKVVQTHPTTRAATKAKDRIAKLPKPGAATKPAAATAAPAKDADQPAGKKGK